MITKTAVEWMVEQVELISNNKTLSKKDAVKLYNEVIQNAKAMEREQMGLCSCKPMDENIKSVTIVDPISGKTFTHKNETYKTDYDINNT